MAFEFLRRNPQAAQGFQAAMSERTAAFAPSVATGYDFSPMRTVADIGGGKGTLLAAILRTHGHLRGVLFDLPQMVADAADVLRVAGDADAVRILSACRRAMAKDGRVLIVERLIADDPAEAVPVLLSDLNMLVVSGGRERTNTEYGQLLAEASLNLARVQPVSPPYGVIEGLRP